MKRSARTGMRDSARRRQRLKLIQHDVPALSLPSPGSQASTGSVVPASFSDADLDARITQRLDAALTASVHGELDALRVELARLRAEGMDAQADAAASAPSTPAQAAPAQAEKTTSAAGSSPVTATASTPAQNDTSSAQKSAGASAKSAAKPAKKSVAKSAARPAKDAASGVRVVTRKSISGDAAREDSAPSLARVAPKERAPEGLAARCIAHAGQHYRGATEDEVIEAWNAMRERFHLSPENKIVARRALLKWLQRSKNVCASNVHWYGDFVAIRSCGVRVPNQHPASGTDGWFILFDPNGDAVMREALFSEAFETPSSRYAGAVPRLGKPAWLSEERRAAAAARHGGADLRPFSPETADDLSAQDFFRGRAE